MATFFFGRRRIGLPVFFKIFRFCFTTCTHETHSYHQPDHETVTLSAEVDTRSFSQCACPAPVQTVRKNRPWKGQGSQRKKVIVTEAVALLRKTTATQFPATVGSLYNFEKPSFGISPSGKKAFLFIIDDLFSIIEFISIEIVNDEEEKKKKGPPYLSFWGGCAPPDPPALSYCPEGGFGNWLVVFFCELEFFYELDLFL